MTSPSLSLTGALLLLMLPSVTPAPGSSSVLILTKGKEDLSYGYKYHPICGGVLVSESWVLTSKGCVSSRSRDNLAIVMGKQELGTIETQGHMLPASAIKAFQIEKSGDFALIKINSAKVPGNMKIATLSATKFDGGNCLYKRWSGLDIGREAIARLQQFTVFAEKDITKCNTNEYFADEQMCVINTANTAQEKPTVNEQRNCDCSGALFCGEGFESLAGISSGSGADACFNKKLDDENTSYSMFDRVSSNYQILSEIMRQN